MVAITQQTLADEVRRMQKLSRSIAADQTAISTGKKLISPSQDPQTWVQVSELGRAQAQQAAWNANVAYAQTRAAKAESNLGELNNLFTRAKELMITASTTTLDEAGKAAVAKELDGIRASVNELLNEKDYQGTPVFDDTNAILVPLARGINVEAVGTRQSIAEGVDVNGTPMTLDQILSDAIASVSTGTSADRTAAQLAMAKGLDHVILQQSVQGVRGDRLEAAQLRLEDTDLTLAERRSGLEDTDLTETLAGLQSKLVTLQAAQSAFARINQRSLFDLIT